jgi:hypothetical protein
MHMHGVGRDRLIQMNIQFSMRQLIIWLSVYALLLGVMAGLPMLQIQVFAAITVVTAFVIIDRISARDHSATPALARCSILRRFRFWRAFSISRPDNSLQTSVRQWEGQ